MSGDERKPLLNLDNNSSDNLYGGSTSSNRDGSTNRATAPSFNATVSPTAPRLDVAPDELPPPYSVVSSGGGVPMVTCKVCQSMIDISGKRTQHVAKCNNCNEATPIKNPPAGKKYVRCQCNCLLICKDTSQRIACPRADCRRIINLAVGPRTAMSPGMCRATCGHCHETFIFDTLNNALARCPQCRKVSSVGDFARRRGYIYLILGTVMLLIGLIVTVTTFQYARSNGGVYFVYVGAFVSAILLYIRAVYCFTMKVSLIDCAA